MRLASALCWVFLLTGTADIAHAQDLSPKETWLQRCRTFRRNFDREWGNAQQKLQEIGTALPEGLKKSPSWTEMQREQEKAGIKLQEIATLLLKTEADDPVPGNPRMLATSLETLRTLSRALSAVVNTMEQEARAAEAIPRANWHWAPLGMWERSLDRSVGLLESLDRACRNRQLDYESVLSKL